MKAPDKIYIHRTIHFGLLSASEIDITGQDEQYIRKDALLEWAKEKAEDYRETTNIRRSFEMMIRKIESL